LNAKGISHTAFNQSKQNFICQEDLKEAFKYIPHYSMCFSYFLENTFFSEKKISFFILQASVCALGWLSSRPSVSTDGIPSSSLYVNGFW